jgi:glycosyltransferase involved in cell wall biosynthesis
MTAPIRLGVVCDYPEEGWLSMDLVAEMVLAHLGRDHADAVRAGRLVPTYRRRLAALPGLAGGRRARNLDRLVNRFADYPRYLRRVVREARHDLFHLVDHSYAQLVHDLPPGRAVVSCHDLDTFRCLLEPAAEPRSGPFRAMTRRILDGLGRAAAVACASLATRSAILEHGLVPPDRLRVVYLAVHPECSPEPDPEADEAASRLLGPAPADGPPTLLHVGSNIPRKRIDVLLKTFAGVRAARPDARLIKVGGAFTPEQSRLAEDLGIAGAIAVLPVFSPRDPRDRATLAAVYRRAHLALQTSDAEGFGLPVAEAMACGTPVLASDIPVLREVGGEPAAYAPVGDIPAWVESALALLDLRLGGGPAWAGRRASALAWADRYRWTTHARDLVEIYRDVLAGRDPGREPGARDAPGRRESDQGMSPMRI